jgi:hypothetical protein
MLSQSVNTVLILYYYSFEHRHRFEYRHSFELQL